MRTNALLRRSALILALLASQACPAQSVAFNGSLGSKAALLMIDGEARTVQVGQTVNGVKLTALNEDRATVEVDGRRQVLVLGATPGRIGRPASAEINRQMIVLASGPGGHFTPAGTINGHVTQFLVDTGATSVSITQAEADRIGLRYREGRRILTQTANGTVPAHLTLIDSLRIGDVEVRNVEAIVIPGQMSHVLLGNSFLTRFQMKRENDVMTLVLRY
ncbi:retropepsin-like aspartic protease [Pelomonas sp. SE-A7]|uniref:retropepsin-like aspartic protease family protein n=1 Tax=Pelomonas sp. SE-A7 TaxID=3054953 RepID=UPI00259CBAF0|nr:retropepsin-like aspartic protease [Pelomonas sp. SE-A7]MDM4765609.1 retropepsin-like aspartic protease [Pelomonas sp. SE-A7]